MKMLPYILCSLVATAAVSTAALIPLPSQIEPSPGVFKFDSESAIRWDVRLMTEAGLLAAELQSLTGSKPQLVKEEHRNTLSSEIQIDLDPNLELAPGGYHLHVGPGKVRIVGKDPAGAWNGTRSLLQLLPPTGDGAWKDGAAEIAGVKIIDEPRFGWRGMLLDVGRHFYPVEDIKGFIDWLAFHKLNVFHWHLTEDQGWRIEIKKYPKLTEIGAYRESTPPYGNRNSDDGQRYGGFYTQEQIKDIVAYAKERHVTIVPEIDMPGHMAAAIAAYPELGNADIPDYKPRVMTRWGVHPYTLAPTEETFRFVDDVLTEVCSLFPSEYIHIGGDEAPKDQWENSPRVKELMKKKGLKNGHDVQSYFIKRVDAILEKKGRKLVGWDEIREGGLAPSATVMSWRGEKGGIASAKEGHDVVMASNTHLYFNYYQYPKAQELAKGPEFEVNGSYVPLKKVYSYNPVPSVLNQQEAKHILGVQGSLWSEFLKTWDKVEYMGFPRIAALAEVAWTADKRKNYKDFSNRLESLVRFYDAAGVNHAMPAAPAKRETKDGSKVTSSLSIRQNHWPELAYDGRPETFFWADRALQKGDHFTIDFTDPVSGKITVKTGGAASRNGDKLENGMLEASTDGSTWVQVAKFAAGTASGKLPSGATHARIRVSKPQTNWLIIHEVIID